MVQYLQFRILEFPLIVGFHINTFAQTLEGFSVNYVTNWLVVWNIFCSTIYGIILPIDHFFSRWLKHVKTTNQQKRFGAKTYALATVPNVMKVYMKMLEHCGAVSSHVIGRVFLGQSEEFHPRNRSNVTP